MGEGSLLLVAQKFSMNSRQTQQTLRAYRLSAAEQGIFLVTFNDVSLKSYSIIGIFKMYMYRVIFAYILGLLRILLKYFMP